MLIEYQFHLTSDSQTGGATAYLLRMDDQDSQWEWVADTDFGPFDTTTDITTWLLRQLTQHAPRRLR
jgi:hypothetical protein